MSAAVPAAGPRVAVMGAGAIGTWMGAALAEAGVDTTLVARGAHLQALQAQGGARLVDAAGERTVPVRAVASPAEAGGPVDVVIAAVKAHDLLTAAPTMAPLLHDGTVVVAAQNGIPWWWFHGTDDPGRTLAAVDPTGTVAAALPPACALGSVVYLGASIAAPGVVDTRPEAGLILGEPDGTTSSRLELVASLLERAGFPVRRTTDIRAEIFTKLMGNASINLMSVLTRAGLGTMVNDAGTGPIIERLMREITELAAAAGHPVQLSVEERIAVTRRLGDHKSSTLQDLEAGKRLELDALGAAVVELADVAAVAAPTLRAVYATADLQARSLGLR